MNLVRPLEWPAGVARTRGRKNGQFRSDNRPITVTAAIGRLAGNLAKVNAKGAELSANFGTTRGGNIARFQDSCDPGAALRFDRKGRPHVMKCDTFTDLAQNIAALAGHLEMLRGIERYGVQSTDEMIGAFMALPAPQTHWEVLGVFNGDKEGAEAEYRKLAKIHHPDMPGGDPALMRRLNEAITRIREGR